MLAKILEASRTCPHPMYIRLGSGRGEAEVYDGDYEFRLGEAIEARAGKDACIISFGTIITEALQAAETLSKEGVDVQVIDMHTIKPIDVSAVLTAAKTGRVVTLEDHNIIGGLGSAVAEVLAEANVPCKFKRLGIPDCYAHFGSPTYLHRTYRYDSAAVVSAIQSML